MTTRKRRLPKRDEHQTTTPWHPVVILMVLAVAETTAIRLMGQLLRGCSSMENNNRPRMGICAAVCGCNFIPQAEISIDMEMQERHHFTICMPCLSECGTATGIDCTNLRLTMLPEMQTQFQPTWLLIVLQWTDRSCRAAHRTRSSCWTTSKLMGMTVLAVFALMHRRLKAKFHHLKFPAAMERAPSPTLNPLPNSLLRTHMPFISKIVSPRRRTWATEVTMDLDLLGQMVRYSI